MQHLQRLLIIIIMDKKHGIDELFITLVLLVVQYRW